MYAQKRGHLYVLIKTLKLSELWNFVLNDFSSFIANFIQATLSFITIIISENYRIHIAVL